MTFDQLYDKYFSALCVFGKNIYHGPSDVVEDAVLKAYASIHPIIDNFSTEKEQRQWLYTTVKHELINQLVSNKRVKNKLTDYELPIIEESIEQNIIKSEIIRLLYAEIEKLPKRMCQIIKLTYFEELTAPEIAKILNTSTQTIRNQRSRALQILRAYYLLNRNEAAYDGS